MSGEDRRQSIDPLIAQSRSHEHGSLASNWQHDPWDNPSRVSEYEELHDNDEFPRLRRALRVGVPVLVALMLLVGGGGLWYVRQVNPSGLATVADTFTVNEGDTLTSVSKRLEEQGLISNAWVFRLYANRRGGIDLQPGYYAIKADDHMGNIMRILKTPPSQTYQSVTFPEGFTIAQIGERLAANTRLDSAKFASLAESGSIRSVYQPALSISLEGLLFPDTYQISGSESEAQVAERMVKLMERVGRQEGLDSAQAKVGYTPYQVLIVASMVEREAKVDEDRAKIARVIYNRLAMDMELQIDATLLYKQDPNLSFADLKAIDTFYNTYLYKGLPPTPIANPGRASIRAALNPAPNPPPGDPICVDLPRPTDCQYIYYVIANKSGAHKFAATLDQHLANVEDARRKGLL